MPLCTHHTGGAGLLRTMSAQSPWLDPQHGGCCQAGTEPWCGSPVPSGVSLPAACAGNLQLPNDGQGVLLQSCQSHRARYGQGSAGSISTTLLASFPLTHLYSRRRTVAGCHPPHPSPKTCANAVLPSTSRYITNYKRSSCPSLRAAPPEQPPLVRAASPSVSG